MVPNVFNINHVEEYNGKNFNINFFNANHFTLVCLGVCSTKCDIHIKDGMKT